MTSKNKKSNSKKIEENKSKTDKIETQTKSTEPSLKNDKILLISILVILVCILALILIPKLTDKNTETNIETVTYKGFVFEKYGDIWVTQLQVKDWVRGWDKPYEIYFHYTPYEVEHIPSLKNSRNDSTAPDLFMNADLIYITTDPKYPASVILGGVEISKILGNVYEKQVKSALTMPDNRTDAPVKTCEDISEKVRIIQLKLGNSTRIYSNNGCVVVEGETPIDLLMASEKLAFEMLKII